MAETNITRIVKVNDGILTKIKRNKHRIIYSGSSRFFMTTPFIKDREKRFKIKKNFWDNDFYITGGYVAAKDDIGDLLYILDCDSYTKGDYYIFGILCANKLSENYNPGDKVYILHVGNKCCVLIEYDKDNKLLLDYLDNQIFLEYNNLFIAHNKLHIKQCGEHTYGLELDNHKNGVYCPSYLAKYAIEPKHIIRESELKIWKKYYHKAVSEISDNGNMHTLEAQLVVNCEDGKYAVFDSSMNTFSLAETVTDDMILLGKMAFNYGDLVLMINHGSKKYFILLSDEDIDELGIIMDIF